MYVIPRIGIGTDAHVVNNNRPCWVAGLLWEGADGLDGHTDGDPVAHAACDALFSAAGLGDLGSNFGADLPEFAGKSGVFMLAETAMLVRAIGSEIGNVAIQLIGNQPRIESRRTEAERVLSEAIAAPIQISATTTDGLGFTGRGEGVVAVAVALVYRHPSQTADFSINRKR
jgi:2-C-methyl-D-erythritol 2,4-cyclodiphosphate synthase